MWKSKDQGRRKPHWGDQLFRFVWDWGASWDVGLLMLKQGKSWINPDELITLSDPHPEYFLSRKRLLLNWWTSNRHLIVIQDFSSLPPKRTEEKGMGCKMYELGHSSPEGRALPPQDVVPWARGFSGGPKPCKTCSVTEGGMIKWLCYGYRASWKNRWCRSGFHGYRLCNEDSVAKDLLVLAPWSEGNRVGQRARGWTVMQALARKF